MLHMKQKPITDEYCLHLLEVMRKHDFDEATLAEREVLPVMTIRLCIGRAKQLEMTRADQHRKARR
jgi:hypothetical protein